MVTFRVGLEMFCFSVMEPSFCLANIEFITVPATSFIDDLGPLRSVQAIFVWKEGFDAACVLENDLEIDERVETVYAGSCLGKQILIFWRLTCEMANFCPQV